MITPGDHSATLLLESGEQLIGLKAAREVLAESGGEDLPPPKPEHGPEEESIITGTSFHTISVSDDRDA